MVSVRRLVRNSAGEWDGYVVDLAKALGEDIGFNLVDYPVVGPLFGPKLLQQSSS